MSERSEAQKQAERAYRASKVSVLLRLDPALAKRLDKVRGKGKSRALYIVELLESAISAKR